MVVASRALTAVLDWYEQQGIKVEVFGNMRSLTGVYFVDADFVRLGLPEIDFLVAPAPVIARDTSVSMYELFDKIGVKPEVCTVTRDLALQLLSLAKRGMIELKDSRLCNEVTEVESIVSIPLISKNDGKISVYTSTQSYGSPVLRSVDELLGHFDVEQSKVIRKSAELEKQSTESEQGPTEILKEALAKVKQLPKNFESERIIKLLEDTLDTTYNFWERFLDCKLTKEQIAQLDRDWYAISRIGETEGVSRAIELYGDLRSTIRAGLQV